MDRRRFSLAGRLASFRDAFAGLAFVLRTQHNAWLHVMATAAVVVLGLVVGVARTDWLWLVVAIALVWVAEITNTAFEHLCDVVSPELNASVRKAKDVAAAAVLVASTASAIIGAVVFWPYLVR
jgi:diacylglycerol kinase (ATP)